MNPQALVTGVNNQFDPEVRLRELIAFSKENKGRTFGQKAGMIDQAIEHLKALRKGELINAGERQRSATPC
jgi:hypothetical protein